MKYLLDTLVFKLWLDVFALWNFAKFKITVQFSSVQSLSCVQLFVTPWIAVHQASLPITSSWSSLRLMSVESVMPSSHLILCRPLLLLPPIPPNIRVFSNESTLRMKWPKCWSFRQMSGYYLKLWFSWYLPVDYLLSEKFSLEMAQTIFNNLKYYKEISVVISDLQDLLGQNFIKVCWCAP